MVICFCVTNYPQTWLLKATNVCYLNLSRSGNIMAYLGTCASKDLTELQLRCWLGLKFHLKTQLWKDLLLSSLMIIGKI